MSQKIKNMLVSISALATLLVPAMVAVPASAATNPDVNLQGSLCTGSNFTVQTTAGDTQGCQSGTSDATLNQVLAKVINVFSAIVGVIAVIMIIVGGLRYITSGGDSGKVGAAKTTIIYALIGLVVVALAQLIVHFVLNQANGIINGA